MENDLPASLKGHFLISESNMMDPNFKQTVVFMVEHNDEGGFGLVVNRQSDLTVADIIPELANDIGARRPVYVGGPVQQELVSALHSALPDGPSSTAMEIVPGVFFEPGFRQLQKFFEPEIWESIPLEDQPVIHTFLGYSGWAPGQLEEEMRSGSWVTLKARPNIVFHPNPEQGWRDALRAKGGIYKIFADSNQDPSFN